MKYEVRDLPTVLAVCRELLSTKVETQAAISASHDAAVYRVGLQGGKSAVVKIRYGSAQWRAWKEARFFKAVGKSGLLGTPTVLACGAVNNMDATALVTSDLEGQQLSELIARGLCSESTGRRLIGALLATFQQLTLPSAILDAQRAHEKLENPANALTVLASKQISALRLRSLAGIVAQVSRPLGRMVELGQSGRRDWVWCHGDLHQSNVILSSLDGISPTPYIVDFESTIQCVPEYDIAKSIVTSSALRESETSDILSGFGADSGISEELVHALVVLHAVDGWLYAAQVEKRDCRLWNERLIYVMEKYASEF